MSLSLASSLWWSSPLCTPSSHTHPWKRKENACKYTIGLTKLHNRWINNWKTWPAEFIDFFFYYYYLIRLLPQLYLWFTIKPRLCLSALAFNISGSVRSPSQSCFTHNIRRHVWDCVGFFFSPLVVLNQQLKSESCTFTSSETWVFSVGIL